LYRTAEAQKVIYKHVQLSYYNPLSYVISVVLCHFALLISETFIFTTIVYWMTGFAADAGRYFFFMLVIFCCNCAISTFFRWISYIVKNQYVAQQITGPFVGLSVLFSGVLITRSHIPNWLIEFYYLLPYSWAVQSVAQSEYSSQGFVDNGSGVAFLNIWDFRTDLSYRYASVGYLLGLFCMFIFLSGRILKKDSLLGAANVIGTKRNRSSKLSTTTSKNHVIQVGSSKLSDLSTFNFIPTDLSFENINYYVQVTENKVQRKRQLLCDVSGYAKAGEITALMGPSGAG
jgi:ABC-type multidrug transport system fused ATPase/permease subunit